VCVQNSFRSQVAEALFNSVAPEGWHATSAGPKPALSVNGMAIELMRERGLDISANRPKMLTKELISKSDMVVIVCSGSECPVVGAEHVEDWDVPDPSGMSTEDAREIVGEIEEKVRDLVRRIELGEAPLKGPRFKIG